MPIASTFMFLMGCCGESILRIPKTSLGMGVDEAQGEQLRPQIQSEAGLRVLDYLHRLKEFSPPDILEMDWDRRTTSFLSGRDRARLLLDGARGSIRKRRQFRG